MTKDILVYDGQIKVSSYKMMAKRSSIVSLNMDRRMSRPSNLLSPRYNSAQSARMSIFTVNSGNSLAWSSMGESMDQTEADSEVLTQLQELNKDADDTMEFVCAVNEIICTTGPFIFLLIVLGVYQVAIISTGVQYLEDCPVAPKIPVFLFVGGAVGLLKVLYTLHTVCRSRRHPEMGEIVFTQTNRGTRRIVDTVLNIFLCCWQLVGTVWTLKVWCPNFKPPLHDPENWCPEPLYVFALVQICVFFGLIVAVALFHCSLAFCYNYTTVFEG